jgi:Na+/proline symporter
MGDKKFLRMMRITIVCFALVVLAFALNSQASIFKMVENAYKVTLAGAFVPLFFGAFWRRSTSTGAMAAIICGIAGWLIVDFGIIEISLVPPQLIGLGASAIAMIVGSLASKPHPNAVHAPKHA